MSGLRTSVLAAKDQLAQAYEGLRGRHATGWRGVEICRAMTSARDRVLLDLYWAALSDIAPEDPDALGEQMTLVAHGGYGRSDVAPFSDVDLMILYDSGGDPRAQTVAQQLFRDVFDTGLSLGHSLRTVREATVLASRDAEICTSLIESRWMGGSRTLFETFQRDLDRQIDRRAASLATDVKKCRQDERSKFGETVYLLQPNVKRTRGGLRDLQLLRWIGRLRYGANDPDELQRLGFLSEEDLRVVHEATEYLLRLRNSLHFHAGRSNDVLDRAEQLRLAEKRGYRPTSGMLPVEQFMRDHFRHAARVSHIVARFLSKARFAPRAERLVSRVFGHRVEGGFHVGPTYIVADSRGRERLGSDLVAVMQLVDLANLYDKRIDPDTWETVRQAAATGWLGSSEASPQLSDAETEDSLRSTPTTHERPPAEAIDYFLSLLAHPARLGRLLRRLSEVGLLERFIPAFAHARGLLQFNQYHKYTVDEHCFRAVDQAAQFASDEGMLGDVYRGLTRKRVLHLALLIHDLGKGFAEDHAEVGLRIAGETAKRLGLSERETQDLEFLVHRHLRMNHLAFRRDIREDQLVVEFAVEVGSPELLGMLFLMTAADLAAVGPGVWDRWKEDVLGDLYRRTLPHLTGGVTSASLDDGIIQRRDRVAKLTSNELDSAWVDRQLNAMPLDDLAALPERQLAEELRMLSRLDPEQVDARAEYNQETGAVWYTVAAGLDATSGLFHRLTGALTSQGLRILSAEINTLADGLALDRFQVVDPDHAGQPTPDRFQTVTKALVHSAGTPDGQQPTFRRTWKSGVQQEQSSHVAQTRVEVDNSTSADFTILDIFTVDRPGLLFRLARTLFELELSVHRAKIGGYLDQVVDVIYVTDRQGRKIEDERRLWAIRLRLLDVVVSRDEES